jgi:aspartyl-tRNA(Asn)/glutamyl-tRNA(Gln) amidotransferase subunit C
MTLSITEAEVRHVAKLSRLKLSDHQIAFFTSQLSHVLDYIAKLNELDVEGVEPMAHPTAMTNKFRDDQPGPTLAIEQVLANAPDADPPFFKVPKVLGEASGA